MSPLRRAAALTAALLVAGGVGVVTQTAAVASDTCSIPRVVDPSELPAPAPDGVTCDPAAVDVAADAEPTCTPDGGGICVSATVPPVSPSPGSTPTRSASTSPAPSPCAPQADRDCGSTTSPSTPDPTTDTPTPPGGGTGPTTPGGGTTGPTTPPAPTGGLGGGNAGADGTVGGACTGQLCAAVPYREVVAGAENPAGAATAPRALAQTGSDLALLVGVALGLVVLGTLTLVARRRLTPVHVRRH